MKKLIIGFLIVLMFFSLSGCNNTDISYSDNYVDKLPENCEDGLTLHAFNWTYKQITDNLEAIKDAGFKNILTMPVQKPKSNGSAWWAFYQPLSFSIGDSSSLGTRDDLVELCKKADEMNIGILADVVVNHMANAGDQAKEEDGTPMVDSAVYEYEPILYNSRNEDLDGHGVTFHHNPSAKGTGSETQVYQWGNLPDLNTANPYVQERVLSLLKECIDIGIDGFRFDAAKHVETNLDNDYASNFWNNTLGVAKKYYQDKTGKQLYVYGEILGYPSGRPLSYYTSLMRITDDSFVSQFKGVMAQKNPNMILEATLKDDCRNLIAWVESHDEYVTNSTHYSDNRIAKYWSIIAGKKDLGGLYFARPVDSLAVGKVGSYAFESAYVAAANHFHNRFYNAASYESAYDKIYLNEKITSNDQGAMIVYVDEVNNKAVEVRFDHLDDGNYYDSITGKKVIVKNQKAKIYFDDNGVAFLTHTDICYPQYDISCRDNYFVDNKEVEISVKNVDKAYCYFNDDIDNKIEFKENYSFKLDDHIKDDQVKLNIVLENSARKMERSFTYNKAQVSTDRFALFNIDEDYFENYEIYIWSWSPSMWSKNYTVEDGVMYVDTQSMDGFLIAIFEKGYEIENIYSWDKAVIKQSVDISFDILKQGYIDMSGF